MFSVVSGMFCFVTVAVSFLYGTRICWSCGKKCDYGVDPVKKKQLLKENMPSGFAVYSFGFLVVFSNVMDGAIAIAVTSFTSAFLLSHFVVSMAMPALRRNPSSHTD